MNIPAGLRTFDNSYFNGDIQVRDAGSNIHLHLDSETGDITGDGNLTLTGIGTVYNELNVRDADNNKAQLTFSNLKFYSEGVEKVNIGYQTNSSAQLELTFNNNIVMTDTNVNDFLRSKEK